MSAMTRCALALCAIALLAFAGAAEAKDKVWEDEKQNVIVRIPGDGSAAWEWLSYKPDWAKSGIVRAARRVLTKLKNGQQPNGQGALLFLAIRDVEEGATAMQVAEDDDTRSFFLKRFGSAEPELDVEESTVESGSAPDKGHPCVILRAEGESPNLKGKKAKCAGVLVVTVFGGKAYLMSMYAFATEFDEEGVEVDLDYMESSALALISTKSKKTGEGPRPPINGGGDGPPADEEEENREDETIEHREQRWRVTIDKKLHRQELTEDDDAENLVLKIIENDANGGVMLYLYAPQTTQYIDGVKAAPPNLIKWMTSSWWNSFTTTHPDGDLFTYKWPSKPEGKNPTFLVVPDLSNEKKRVGVITGKKKRPVEISQSDATKKLKFAEKPKKNKIGKKGKGGEAMRGILEGNRPRVGKETVLRYAWRSPSHSYRLFVVFTRDGYKKYGDPMRRTLESFEFGLKFK